MQTSIIKKILLLALLLVTGSAWAEWVGLGQTNTETYYVDRATIRKEGNLRTVWTLVNLKQRDPTGHMSKRSRLKFDCTKELATVTSTSTHAEAMAAGEVLRSSQYDGDDWIDIPPGSVFESILKIVCAQ